MRFGILSAWGCGLYWPDDDGPRQVYGLGGPDPTAPEGDN
jgi:hypothetical protein